tara:strand:- start:380 stop:691 length:312 start_codon:yes stop_codon:yes gene_type:complete
VHNESFGHRRSSKRRACFLAAGYLLFDKAPYLAKYHDINLDGIGAIVDKPLPVNIQVKIALNTKKKGLVLVKGKVCWCKKAQLGWRLGISFNRKLSYETTMIA